MEMCNDTYLSKSPTEEIINFEKFEMISKEQMEFTAFQQHRYSFIRISEIYEYLIQLHPLSDDDLFEHSTFIEVMIRYSYHHYYYYYF